MPQFLYLSNGAADWHVASFQYAVAIITAVVIGVMIPTRCSETRRGNLGGCGCSESFKTGKFRKSEMGRASPDNQSPRSPGQLRRQGGRRREEGGRQPESRNSPQFITAILKITGRLIGPRGLGDEQTLPLWCAFVE